MKFSEFPFLDSLKKSLREQRLQTPTEVQARIIPLMLTGESVVGLSETGSGKTLSYALPILHTLKSLESEGDAVTHESSPRAVILVPTRELGDQIARVFKTLTHDTRLRVRAALGGTGFEQTRRNIAGAFEILLATPGRLTQLMSAKLIDLEDVRMLIFDEADQMMDEGFKADSNKIAEACPDELQLGLFSATVNPAVQELMDSLFAKANVIKSAGAGKTVKTLVTKNHIVKEGKRWPVLERLLEKEMKTLLFTNTREQCDRIAKELSDKGYACAIYRGEMDPVERRANLKRFREGKISLLVSTDLGGRGLDVDAVERVINYHLPRTMDNYIHRVGRTARAGREGLVVNLVTERDEPIMAKLENRAPRPYLERFEKKTNVPKSGAAPARDGARTKKRSAAPARKGSSTPASRGPAPRSPGSRGPSSRGPASKKPRR